MLVLPYPFDWADGHKFVYDPAKKHTNLGALPYRVILGPGTLIESDGAPFVAYVPAFGNHSIRAYGDTPQEALDDLEAMVAGMLVWWREEYGSLPEEEWNVFPTDSGYGYGGAMKVKSIPEVPSYEQFNLRTERVALDMSGDADAPSVERTVVDEPDW